ncbi:MAG: hypothetical protein ABIG34_01520 [Candidatus Peregrinibacteria bacterium]
MMSLVSPLPAPNTNRLPIRSRIVLLGLFLCLMYPAYILVQEWEFATAERAVMSDKPALRALLFQEGARLQIFDMSLRQDTVRSTKPLNTTDILSSARLLSPRIVLVGSGAQTQVLDLVSSYTYNATDRESPLTLLSRNTNFTYTLSDDPDRARLTIDFAECGEIADIPLPERGQWYEPEALFETLGLSMQNSMRLSPAETSLALVKHGTFPRTILVNLIQRNAIALSVPSFDPEQIHFSPFFIDDQTLLFSVLDRKQWATVLYHISTGTYETLSIGFTDHAYHTLTGKIILVQSFYDDALNIPFGSVALLGQKREISVQEIEAITGPRADSANIFALLFQQPDASILHFKSDLTTQSFNAINQSDVRESLRTFWLERQQQLARAVGNFRLLQLNSNGATTLIDTIPFEIRPPAITVQYVDNVEPLLKALELTPGLIEEYRKRNAFAIKSKSEYVLVDDLSY